MANWDSCWMICTHWMDSFAWVGTHCTTWEIINEQATTLNQNQLNAITAGTNVKWKLTVRWVKVLSWNAIVFIVFSIATKSKWIAQLFVITVKCKSLTYSSWMINTFGINMTDFNRRFSCSWTGSSTLNTTWQIVNVITALWKILSHMTHVTWGLCEGHAGSRGSHLPIVLSKYCPSGHAPLWNFPSMQ